MKGRKPYPYQVISATNGKDHLTKEQLEERRKNEPKIESHSLRCPAYLSPEARKEWRRITRLYKEFETPLINNLDANLLEIYCEASATYHKAMEKVRESSEVYAVKGDPHPRKNPWLVVANEAASRIQRTGESLLLDPVSRARAGMAKNKEDEDDPIAAIVARRIHG